VTQVIKYMEEIIEFMLQKQAAAVRAVYVMTPQLDE
jgi:hypothetical protein